MPNIHLYFYLNFLIYPLIFFGSFGFLLKRVYFIVLPRYNCIPVMSFEFLSHGLNISRLKYHQIFPFSYSGIIVSCVWWGCQPVPWAHPEVRTMYWVHWMSSEVALYNPLHWAAHTSSWYWETSRHWWGLSPAIILWLLWLWLLVSSKASFVSNERNRNLHCKYCASYWKQGFYYINPHQFLIN